MRVLLATALALPLAFGIMTGSAPLAEAASSSGIVAVANDQPITALDITQRISLLEILGDLPADGMSKQAALKNLIDDQVKIIEATRFNLLPSDAEISERIDRVAKGMNLSRSELLSKLKARGISEASFRQYLKASTGFSRIIASKYRDDVKVTDAEVDAKQAEIKGKAGAQMSKIMKDPRMKPVTVYSIMEIMLPLDGDDPMLVQSRAIEAQQVIKRLNGCGSVKAASEGVFNVKPGKVFEADAAKLPPKMKDALDKAGQGRAVGPMRSKGGIQIVALCGVRKIAPPKPDFKMPTREQVERLVTNEKYDRLEEDYLKLARDKVYVEYRDPSYAQN